MSSISQIERSSSHTRMLAMRSPSRAHYALGSRIATGGEEFLIFDRYRGPHPHAQPPQPQHECRSLSHFRARPDIAFVSLNDLVHDGQTKPGAAVESRL